MAQSLGSPRSHAAHPTLTRLSENGPLVGRWSAVNEAFGPLSTVAAWKPPQHISAGVAGHSRLRRPRPHHYCCRSDRATAATAVLFLERPPKANDATASLTRPTLTASIRIVYRSHTGSRRAAMVLVPRSYRTGDQPIPLVIAPHGRGVSHKVNAHRWGNLPGIGGFAVVSPAGQGNHLRSTPGEQGAKSPIWRGCQTSSPSSALAQIDRRRIYAFGGSMGGQETLLLAARHPDCLRERLRSTRWSTSRGNTATSRDSAAARLPSHVGADRLRNAEDGAERSRRDAADGGQLRRSQPADFRE